MARRTGLSDTKPDAEHVWLDLMRRASPEKKLYMVGQMNEAIRALALEGLRARHPSATPDELRRRLADLVLGPELAAKVYGPIP